MAAPCHAASRTGGLALGLLLPEASEAGGSTEFQGFGLLVSGDVGIGGRLDLDKPGLEALIRTIDIDALRRHADSPR
jgi:hypothetical protein